MRKADDLRKWLMRSVPGLKNNPDRLHMHLANGGIDFQRSADDNFSFGYRFDCIVTLIDYVGDLDAFTLPLIIWLARNEPAAIDKVQDGTALEIDVVDHDRYDIEIILPLKEAVKVIPDPDNEGGYRAEHPPEPPFPPIFPDIGEPKLAQIFLDEMAEVERRFLAAGDDDVA